MSYYSLTSLLLVLVMAISSACTEPRTPMDLAQVPLIPYPAQLEASGSSFALSSGSSIYVDTENADAARVAEQLAEYLRPATGFSLAIKPMEGNMPEGSISLDISDELNEMKPEGYILSISELQVNLRANAAAGLFEGVQTLRQLFPAKIEMSEKQKGPWEIASGTITDQPEYAYRGAMLDVARHFFSVEELKQYIDYLAAYKINALHLHLSDDQGWRIEIKSWPNLTAHGGSLEVGGTEGGFYTQEEYRDLVKYAQDRHMMIIPEIDMPGHTNAALASYPELNCNGKAPDLYTGIEVGFSTLCTDKEITYQFVDDVVRELASLTPGPYIHIGGDESHATAMKDYIPFVERVQEIVLNHDKIAMGWDEIVNAKLDGSTIAQYWASEENAQGAVEQKVQLIMSPAQRTYLDMQYDSTTQLGLHWAAYIEVDDAYTWDPATYSEQIGREDILGIEAPLWSETVTNLEELEYMVFPRLPGIAEIAWSPASVRDWETYKVRLGKQKARFEAMGINFYASDRVPWTE